MLQLLFSWLLPTVVKAQGFDFIGNIPCVQDDYPNPGTCTIGDVTSAVGYLINLGVAISGALALLMFVIGGWYLVASAGRKEWISRGKNILTNTVFSIFFILGAWLIVQGVLKIIGSEIQLENGTVAVSICDRPESNQTKTACSGNGVANGFCQDGACVSKCAYEYRQSGKPFDCHAASYCFPAGTNCAENAGHCVEANGLCPTSQFCCYPNFAGGGGSSDAD